MQQITLHPLVLYVPLHSKESLESELADHTPELNEVVLRIGLDAVKMLQNVHITDGNEGLVRDYEMRLKEKDQERACFERILLENQEKVLEQRMKIYQDQVTKLEDQIRVLEDKKAVWVETSSAEILAEKQEVARLREQMSAMERLKRLEVESAIETLKIQWKDSELRHLSQENTKVSALQEALSHALLEKERIKTDLMNGAMKLQQEQLNEMRETLLSSKKTSTSAGLGQAGEKFFEELAHETFDSFDAFELIDTTRQTSMGDYHCSFEKFTVLVDAKNFVAGPVSTRDRQKFYFDMERNPSIKVGWMCSVSGYIAGVAKRPYVFEIRNGQLLCYINNMKNSDNPGRLLEDVYFACEFIYHTVINKEARDDVVAKYKKYELHVKQVVSRLMKHTKKAKDSIKMLTSDLCEQEQLLQELLCDNLLDMRNSDSTMVELWFSQFVEASGEESKLKSNVLYDKFQETVGEGKHITMDMFKVFLKGMIPKDKIQIPKTTKANYTLSGYRMKE